MDRTVAIIVPSKSSKTDDHPCHAAIVRDVAREFSLTFGGATATPGHGYWVDNDGELVEESVTVVESVVPDKVLDYTKDITLMEVVRHVKEVMQQDTVMYKINNHTFFY